MPKRKHRKPGSIRKSKIPAVIIGLAIVTAIVGAIGAKPLGRAYKATRAKSLVADAKALTEEGRIAPAFEKAREAFDLAPEHPDVMRLLGNLMKDNPYSRDNAKYFLKELVSKGEANADDKISLAGVYLAEGEESEARALLSEVETSNPQHAGAIALRARLNPGGGGAALATPTPATPAAPIDRTASERLELAKAQLAGGNRELVTQATTTLWELARGEDNTALRAMEMLSSASRMSQERGRELKELLAAHPQATDKHQLVAKSLEMRMDPTRSEQIVAEEVKKRLGKPIAELTDFLAWLIRENQSGWVLDLIPEEVAKKSPQTLAYHVEALSRDGQWDRLDLLLLDGELPVNDSQRVLLQSRCAIALKKPDEEIRNLLKNAMGAAARAGDFRSVAAATQLAQSENYEEVTQLGLSMLVTSPVWKESALLGYFQLASDDSDSDKMLETAEDVLRENPKNERFQHISSYLHLLKGTQIEIASNTARELLNRSGQRPDRTILNALAQLRLGNIEGAASACEGIDPLDLRPGSRAVYANILRRTGKTTEATKIARKIPLPLLLAEERALLNW